MASLQLAQTKDEFERAVRELSDHTDIARPALLIAADEYPGLDVDHCLRQIDDLADAALISAVAHADDERTAAVALARFLFDEMSFRGNVQNYYDPANSYLNRVLDRRTGIPITLSVLLIAVGRRLALPLVGIGMPTHFLTACDDGNGVPLLLDPFTHGGVLTLNDCRLRLANVGMEFDPAQHLKVASNRDILLRMLGNLRTIFTQQGDVDKALRTIRRMVLLDHAAADELRNLGASLLNDGQYSDAQKCLRAYLEQQSEGDGADKARELLTAIFERRARRN